MRISDWSSDVCSSDLLAPAFETLEGWSKMIAVNQTALFLGLKMVAPEIAKSGNGAILNISSLVSVICEPGLISYAATKSAVRAMTTDRKRVVYGKRVSVRVDLVGRRIIKKQKIK